MKQVARGAVGAALLLVTPAYAADILVKAPPPVAGWTGFYIGGNAGWIGSSGNTIDLTGTDTGTGGLGSALTSGFIPGSIDLGYSGFLGGGQFGYNWQSGAMVVGVEADLDAASASAGVSVPDARFNPPVGLQSPFTINATRQLDWIGTLRARFGITPSAPWLFYATGGLAFGEHQVGIGVNDPTALPPAVLFNQSAVWSAGWTIGVGGEWMFAPRWSMKLEYLYVDLGDVSSTIAYTYNGGTQSSTLTATVHDRDNIVRAGVDFHL